MQAGKGYYGDPMKRLWHSLFPLLFALGALVAHWALHASHPTASERMTGLLTFCTALAWSAMIHQLPRNYRRWTGLYLAVALLLPLPFLLGLAETGIHLAQHDTLYLLMVFGILELKFYMVTTNKKRRPDTPVPPHQGDSHG